jgi:4-amino-4-deoxy-L-arabinose transferase-like glycosyltransferase
VRDLRRLGGEIAAHPVLALGAVLVVAFAVRLAAILVIEVNPRAQWSFDMTWYDGMARRLLAGKGYTSFRGAPTAQWPPGYPLLLAGVYAVLGQHVLVAKLVNAGLATASVLVTYLIGRELGRPRVGLAAAALLAVFPGDVLFAPTVLTEPLFAALVATALWVFLRWTRGGEAGLGRWAAFGALLGLATLVRGTGLLLLPIFSLAWLAQGAGLGRTARWTAAAALGLVVVLVPWTVRNQLRLGAFVVVATDGAASLWVGHSPVATGGHSFALRGAWRERFGHFHRLPPLQAEIEVARAETREALGWMLRRPDRVVALVPAKVYHMFKHDRGALGWMEPWLQRRLHPTTRRGLEGLVDGYFFAVLALALVGARHFLRPDDRRAALVPIAVAWLVLAHAVLFFGSPRFHHPLLPLLSLLAGAELVAWARPATAPRTA